MLCLAAQSCLTLCHPMDCSTPGSSVHGDSPGKNSGVGCHAQTRGWTQVSHIATRFFTIWATREAQEGRFRNTISDIYVLGKFLCHYCNVGRQNNVMSVIWLSEGSCREEEVLGVLKIQDWSLTVNNWSWVIVIWGFISFFSFFEIVHDKKKFCTAYFITDIWRS